VAKLADVLEPLAHSAPALITPATLAAAFAFALLCGSGIAATQGLLPLAAPLAAKAGLEPLAFGAAVTVAAAAGRTASPVAAVNLFAAQLAGVRPEVICRRHFLPIALGALAAAALATFRAWP
jgi:DcuC family C4-dicarboxylate transporter